MGGQPCCCSHAGESVLEADTRFAEAKDCSVIGGPDRDPSAPRAADAAGLDDTLEGESGDAAEDENEKARLQGLVNAFAREAVRGRQCALFDQSTGRPVQREFWLDSKLEMLSFRPVAQGEVVAEISVASIKDMHAYKDALAHAGEDFRADAPTFPKAAMGQLSPEERSLLIMLVMDGAAGEERTLLLMEQSLEGVSNFVECMRVLVVYARNSVPK